MEQPDFELGPNLGDLLHHKAGLVNPSLVEDPTVTDARGAIFF